MSIIILLFTLLFPVNLFAEGFTECGGNLYCVTEDGVIHSSGLQVGVPEFPEFIISSSGVSFTPSIVGNSDNAVSGVLFQPTVTVDGSCVACEMLGAVYSPFFTNTVANVAPNILGFSSLPSLVIPTGSVVTNFCSVCAGYDFIQNDGTINNYIFLLIESGDFKTGVTSIGTITNLWGLQIQGNSTGVGGDIEGMRNNLPGITTIGVSATAITNAPSPSLVFQGVTQASLGAAVNGTITYCTDCTIASPCAGSGNGALAKRLNGIWVCN
jgi:hypothetical protein